MNGAESLVRTLVAGGVDVCFSNPGTSEMNYVAALDRVERMRTVLCLFENVATGAADGYFRMKGVPATTLLHHGVGLSNGLSNIHNAKKAHSGMINVVGHHPAYHVQYDSPPTSDVEAIARSISGWVRTSLDAKTVAKDAAAAIAAAIGSPPKIATLILPDDTAWNEAGEIAQVPSFQRPTYSPEAVEQAARVLHGDGTHTLLLLTGSAMTEEGLGLARRISCKTGCMVAQAYSPRMARGRGRFAIERIPFSHEAAHRMLKDVRRILLFEARDPEAFFAYQNKPSLLRPESCIIQRVTSWGENSVAALDALASALNASLSDVQVQKLPELIKPTGPINHATIAQAVACAIPENSIVVDESVTAGAGFFPALNPTSAAAPHDWLQNMGGSLGYSTPVAVGAAVACPDRKVITLVGDGGFLYTSQSLWTQAHEGLDVVTVVLNNRRYQILHDEYVAGGILGDGPIEVGATGRKTLDMVTLESPAVDFVRMAESMGVPARAVTTADEFNTALEEATSESGPRLIEVKM